jgi:cytochrome c-type biogenesis protein
MGLLAAAVDSNLYVLTAFGGGLLSFLSPCVLPIVPGYLSLVTGVSVGDLRQGSREHLGRIAFHTAMFVAGFTAVFVVLGLVTTEAGGALFRNQETLTRVSGGLVLLMAAYLAGSQVLMAPSIYREVRFHPHLERFGPMAAPVAGAAFAFGWTPCIGPVLGAVIGLANEGHDTTRAAVLFTAYSLGLGVAFLAVGLLMGRLTGALDWFKRHARAVTFVSAALLAAFGIVLLTDQLTRVTAELQRALDSVGLDWLVTVG